ncbi:hypothetical protein RRSWK_03657 [Rhodopirellula sp. SWK7]|nr:hypothetical protein RRSWK_03657 [Rhodopirellula sp. SWK7]
MRGLSRAGEIEIAETLSIAEALQKTCVFCGESKAATFGTLCELAWQHQFAD